MKYDYCYNSKENNLSAAALGVLVFMVPAELVDPITLSHTHKKGAPGHQSVGRESPQER